MKFYPLTMTMVLETVCAAFGVPKTAVVTSSQKGEDVIMARRVFALLAMRMTRATPNQVAAKIGIQKAWMMQMANQAQEAVAADAEFGAFFLAIQQSLETISHTRLIRFLDDADATAAASKVLEDPFRNATTVSKDAIVAMAARIRDAEEFVGMTAILLQLLNLAAAEPDPTERADIERVTALYRGHLASMLPGLGTELPSQELIHELAA